MKQLECSSGGDGRRNRCMHLRAKYAQSSITLLPIRSGRVCARRGSRCRLEFGKVFKVSFVGAAQGRRQIIKKFPLHQAADWAEPAARPSG